MLNRFLLLQKSLVIQTVVVAVILLERFGGWDGMRMNWVASLRLQARKQKASVACFLAALCRCVAEMQHK